MTRRLSSALGVVVILALIAAPIVFAARQQVHTRNFRVVRDRVLYRSGQLTLPGLARILHDYGIRTVISLRDGTRPEDQREQAFCEQAGIRFVRIEPRAWQGEDHAVPAEENVRAFRAVLDDRRHYPVLVHCFAGIHRTGAYVAIYRMQYEGWSNEQAIAEARACGYTTIDDELDVLGYLRSYPAAKHGSTRGGAD
jgi:protein tyrosine/serine phosphatase